ncbi:MAG: glyoxalase/bleomycin resistance/dioxygenase family protein, partial [Actinomycetota bacterium]
AAAGPAGADGSADFAHLNHLGVEVETGAEVVAAEARLSDSGIETTGVDDTQCCYAEKTETWVAGPDGARWEWYVRTGDSEQLANVVVGADDTEATDGTCCA